MFFINYPNNPTGAVATKEQLKAFVDYARENNILTRDTYKNHNKVFFTKNGILYISNLLINNMHGDYKIKRELSSLGVSQSIIEENSILLEDNILRERIEKIIEKYGVNNVFQLEYVKDKLIHHFQF